MTPQKRYRQTIRGRYTRHKANAARRGIEFNLTFGQWWVIWSTSGYWKKRGPKMTDFVMCRLGDCGPYEWGNVFIGPGDINLRVGGQLTRFRRIADDVIEAFMAPQEKPRDYDPDRCNF